MRLHIASFLLFFLFGSPSSSSSSSSASSSINSSSSSTIAVHGGNLILSPPEGGEVQLNNFTELSLVKESLSIAQEALIREVRAASALNETVFRLLSRLSETEGLLAQTNSNLNDSNARLQASLSEMGDLKTQVANLTALQSTASLTTQLWPSTLDITFSGVSEFLYSFIGGGLNVISNVFLSELSFPLLTRITGDLNINGNSALANVLFPVLRSVSAGFSVSNNPQLVQLAFPLLEYVGGPFFIQSLLALPVVSFPSLRVMSGYLRILLNTALSNVSFPVLETIAGALVVVSNPKLAEASFPNLRNVSSTVWMEGNSNASSKVVLSSLSLNSSQIGYYALKDPELNCNSFPGQNCTTNFAQNIVALGGSTGDTVEVFSAVTKKWDSLPSLSHIAASSPAVGLYQYRVFLAGGIASGSTVLTSSQNLDLTFRVWNSMPPMNAPRCYTSGVVVPFLRIFLVTGGHSGAYVLGSSEAFSIDSTVYSWSLSGLLSTARARHSTVLYRGLPVVLGGNSSTAILASCELFAFNSSMWSSFPAFSLGGRFSFGAAVLQDRIFIAGGFAQSALDSMEVYNGTSWWALSAKLSDLRFGLAMVPLKSTLAILGGSSATTELSDIDLYDPITDTIKSNAFSPMRYSQLRMYLAAVSF